MRNADCVELEIAGRTAAVTGRARPRLEMMRARRNMVNWEFAMCTLVVDESKGGEEGRSPRREPQTPITTYKGLDPMAFDNQI